MKEIEKSGMYSHEGKEINRKNKWRTKTKLFWKGKKSSKKIWKNTREIRNSNENQERERKAGQIGGKSANFPINRKYEKELTKRKLER